MLLHDMNNSRGKSGMKAEPTTPAVGAWLKWEKCGGGGTRRPGQGWDRSWSLIAGTLHAFSNRWRRFIKIELATPIRLSPLRPAQRFPCANFRASLVLEVYLLKTQCSASQDRLPGGARPRARPEAARPVRRQQRGREECLEKG